MIVYVGCLCLITWLDIDFWLCQVSRVWAHHIIWLPNESLIWILQSLITWNYQRGHEHQHWTIFKHELEHPIITVILLWNFLISQISPSSNRSPQLRHERPVVAGNRLRRSSRPHGAGLFPIRFDPSWRVFKRWKNRALENHEKLLRNHRFSGRFIKSINHRFYLIDINEFNWIFWSILWPELDDDYKSQYHNDHYHLNLLICTVKWIPTVDGQNLVNLLICWLSNVLKHQDFTGQHSQHTWTFFF